MRKVLSTTSTANYKYHIYDHTTKCAKFVISIIALLQRYGYPVKIFWLGAFCTLVMNTNADWACNLFVLFTFRGPEKGQTCLWRFGDLVKMALQWIHAQNRQSLKMQFKFKTDHVFEHKVWIYHQPLRALLIGICAIADCPKQELSLSFYIGNY